MTVAQPIQPGLRTFVLDTSVLLSDPGALGRFAEHEVVLPLVVISELEGKRHHPELGWFARQTLRVLDELRITYGRLDAPVPIGDDGRFRPAEQLHERFAAAASRPAIAYCGSGVTACHDLLAMEVAGLQRTALYTGSWSQWGNDPARPAETG